MQDFAGSKVDRNLPSSEEDAGSIPGLGRFTNFGETEPMHQKYSAHVLQLWKPLYLEPVLWNKRRHQNEKPMYHQ